MTGSRGGINIKMSDIFKTDKKIFLNVGCGVTPLNQQSEYFITPEWKEIRVDAFPNATRDIESSLLDLKEIDDESCDVVWACHVVEHMYWHELPSVFNSIVRVLKKDGYAIIRVPDLGSIADKIKTALLEPVYGSAGGAISPIDMIYGHRPSHTANIGMLHKTGFTAQSMSQILSSLGIKAFIKEGGNFEVIALLYKDKEPTDFMKSETF